MATRFADHLLDGTHASRPAATTVPEGTLYACTDHALIYQSDGATWATWATLGSTGAISAGLLDAKGDLIVASAADTAARLPVGTNGYVLTADSAESTGVKWAAAAGGTARFGDNRTSDAVSSGNVDRLYGTPITISGGDLTISLLHAMVFGSGNFKLAVFAADETTGKVAPSTRICATADIAATGAAVSDHSAAPTASTILKNGITYWLAIHIGSNSVSLGRLTTHPNGYVFRTGATFASGVPTAFGTTSWAGSTGGINLWVT